MDQPDNSSAGDPTIFVVGYPKSGNTWLVRLLADALKVPVRDKVMEGAPEMATDVNRELNLQEREVDTQVAKIHYLPQDFTRHVTPEPRRIVYIVRDFRDQCVSSFFYWKREKQQHAQLIQSGELVHWNVVRSALRLKAQWRLQRFCQRLAQGRIAYGPGEYGTWSEHYHAWQQFLGEREGQTDFATVRYEDLLADTEGKLREIIEQLQLPCPDDVADAVERQSFSSLRKQYSQKNGSRTKASFFRSGKSNDYQSYLSPETLRIIQEHQGETLAELGYT